MIQDHFYLPFHGCSPEQAVEKLQELSHRILSNGGRNAKIHTSEIRVQYCRPETALELDMQNTQRERDEFLQLTTLNQLANKLGYTLTKEAA